MKPKKLVLFDLNKTLIKETSWYELNLAMGITDAEDEMLYRLGPDGEGSLTFPEWIGTLAKIMVKRGKASKAAMEKVLLNYHFIDGAKEVVKELQKRGYTVVILTGSFNLVADEAARDLGVEHAYNNMHLVFDKNDMLEDIAITIDDQRYKTLMIRSICRKFGLLPKDVYYVADGGNDILAFEETIGVVVNVKKEVHEPWMQKAIEAGEEFAHFKAADKAKYKIANLRELLDIVK